VDEGTLQMGGEAIAARSAFVRLDVFEALAGNSRSEPQRAIGWFHVVYGWLLEQRAIRLFNRYASPVAANKIATLAMARMHRLAIPNTYVTNDEELIRSCARNPSVVKPVAGGDYCYPLEKVVSQVELRDGCTATPAIVQSRLVPPEVRMYVIGAEAFAFEVQSPSLDYRVRQDASVRLLPQPPAELEQLRALMDELGLDFGAADFKTDSATGQLKFLELNNSPMFSRFNDETGGRLAEAIVRELCPHKIT
jgi:glutathione synthase/RimK-type ligase-like ATP-grasp enzyme